LRSLLVVSEIALSLVALVGAGLFIRSMRDAQRIDPVSNRKNLFMMAFDLGALHYEEGRAQEFFRAAVERANSTPGVKSAGRSRQTFRSVVVSRERFFPKEKMKQLGIAER